MKTFIRWTKFGDRIPSNANRQYDGQPETPYVPCMVYASHPDAPMGGVTQIIRWDTKLKAWDCGDIAKNWTLQPPYQITHFCDYWETPHRRPE